MSDAIDEDSNLTFIHRELDFGDLFAGFKYSFYKMWFTSVRRKSPSEAHELAMKKLTRTEVLFFKGL